MPLQTSLFTGLAGLSVHSRMLDVTGNNISNVNTIAFKKSRISFETQISQTLRNGSAPSADLGGTNPAQSGLGVRLGSIHRDFSDGGFMPSGISTEMAIEGSGFFILNDNGSERYTRAGNFTLDRDYNLVAANGGLVQGYGVDEEFSIVEGILTDVNIPIGVLTVADATTEVRFKGNLHAGGDTATQGSLITTQALYSDALATVAATSATALNSVYDTAGGAVLFSTGDVITVTGMSKGGATLPDHTFEVGPANTTGSDDYGTTLGDLLDFLDEHIGIDSAVSGGIQVSDGVTAIDGTVWPAGQVVVLGNTGEKNDLSMEAASIIVNQATSPTTPFTFTKQQSADGESVRTTFVVYDTLANPVLVDLTVVLEGKSNSGTTWRFYAQSEDDSDLDRTMTNGLLSFDTNGNYVSSTVGAISIDRDSTGAFTPLQVSLTFESDGESVYALADQQENSEVSAYYQDGSPMGTLEDFNVNSDGELIGVFSNGLMRTLGRIPLATLANSMGLEEVSANMYRTSVNSGIAVVVNPGSSGAGTIIGRATELSNVELSDEFITLISASTGFSANARVITTSERLIQELLASVR